MLKLLANLTEALSASTRLAVFWLDFLSLIAIFVVVVAFAHGLRVFARIGMICSHFAPPLLADEKKSNARLGWSPIRFNGRRLRVMWARAALAALIGIIALVGWLGQPNVAMSNAMISEIYITGGIKSIAIFEPSINKKHQSVGLQSLKCFNRHFKIVSRMSNIVWSQSTAGQQCHIFCWKRKIAVVCHANMQTRGEVISRGLAGVLNLNDGRNLIVRDADCCFSNAHIGPQLALRSVLGSLPKPYRGANEPSGSEDQQHRKKAYDKSFIFVREQKSGGREPINRTSEWFAYGGMFFVSLPIIWAFGNRKVLIAWGCLTAILLLVGTISGLK